jgi:hypothetical protein
MKKAVDILWTSLEGQQSRYLLEKLLITHTDKRFSILFTRSQPSFVKPIFEEPVPTSQETCCSSVSESSCLMLFREVFSVYINDHVKYVNTVCG